MTACTELSLGPGPADAAPRDWEALLVGALQALPPGSLPLQASCRQGGWVDDRDIRVSVLACEHHADRIEARIGVFFTETVGGCNCNDDPVESNAYGLLTVSLDRRSGLARICAIAE